MASLRFVNAFDLLGEDETADATVLFERMQTKVVEEVIISENKSKNVYIAKGEMMEELVYEEDEEASQSETNKQENGPDVHENGTENGTTNGDGWITKVERPNRNNDRNVQGDRRGHGYVYVKKIVDNGQVKESADLAKEDDVNVDANANGDTIEPSNGEESETKTEEVEDVSEPQETEEVRKAREEKEAELKREAEEMTLAEYEKLRLEKQRALKEIMKKSEARRVVVVDEDLKSMTVVPRKQANKDPDSTAVLAKKEANKDSESSEKKGDKAIDVGLSNLFRPAPFRRFDNGGRGRGGGRGNRGGRFGPRFNNRPIWLSGKVKETLDESKPVDVETQKRYRSFFPVLGFDPEKAKADAKRGINADTKPVIDAAPKPVIKAIPKPVTEAIPKPVTEAAAKPVVEAAAKQVILTVSEPEPTPSAKASTPLGPKRAGPRRNLNGSRGNPPGSAAHRRNGNLTTN